MRNSLLILAGLLATVALAATGCDDAERLTSGIASPGVAAGKAPADDAAAWHAIADRACFACHVPADGRIPAGLEPLRAPAPEGIATRTDAGWMRRFILRPDTEKPGTPMPRLLPETPDGEETAEDLVHYLVSRGRAFEPLLFDLEPDAAARGATLYRDLGCFACHGPEFPRATLLAKTGPAELAAFLRAPLVHRPGGRMPDFGLSPEESTALAVHLLAPRLQGEALARATVLGRGLDYEYLEGEWDSLEGEFAETPARRRGIAPRPDLSRERRDDRFGFRFSGEIVIPGTGAWTLATRSDDGSRLWIDGELLVDNDGPHPAETKEAEIELAAGAHRIRVEFFENGGDEELQVLWRGPGETELRRVPDEAFRTARIRSAPEGHRPFVLDPERARRGAEHWKSLGCARCHEAESPVPPTRLPADDLTGRGCLSETPPTGAPRFGFAPGEAGEIARVLSERDENPTPGVELARHLARLDCTACHRRGARGPDEATLARFTGNGDWGDEGRLPPRLDGVGRKLTEAALTEVLVEGRKVRPRVNARMPRFGAGNVSGLAALLAATDLRPDDATEEPASDLAAVEAGRRLVGRDGFNCVECHSFAGHDLENRLTVDLAEAAARLRPAWMREVLLEPARTNPGTRMPGFFTGGRTGIPEVLDGDPERQAAAIRAYLRGGRDAIPPKGARIDRAAYELLPTDGPELFATFMRGLSARTVCVGFPERLHYAFDAGNARLARMWRGKFMNARGTWHGRAGALSEPGDRPVHDLPPGPALVESAAELASLPVAGRDAGWRMRGREVDADGTPVFVFARGDLEVRESLRPRREGERYVFVRRLEIRGLREASELRLARGRSITALGGGRFVVEGGLEIGGAEGAVVREVAGARELRRPVSASNPDAPVALVVEVTYSW
ncbi:MAG: PA14 domain-containing protein [Planctomycetota bacterium]